VISLEAMALWLFAKSVGWETITAEKVVNEFPDHGKKYYYRVLKEIRVAGGITMTREFYNGHCTTVQRLTEFPDGSPEKAFLYQLVKPYSYLADYAIKLQSSKAITSKSLPIPKISEKGAKKFESQLLSYGVNVDFEYTADDKEYAEEQQALRAKGRAEKQKAYAEIKETEYRRKVELRDRDRVPAKDWSSSDIAYYFSDNLMFRRWDIPPWQVKHTRFVQALAEKRSHEQTNGAIEKKMVDIYLAEPWVKTVSDSERLWKTFVKRFGSLKEQALLQYHNPDSFAASKELDEARTRQALGLEG